MTVVAGRAPDDAPPDDAPPDDASPDVAAPDLAAPDGAPEGTPGRRARAVVLAGAVAGVVVLAALVGALATPPTTRGDLEPTSAAPQGARAVAQILERQRVDVVTLRRSTEVAAAASSATTVLVAFPERLGPEQLRRLAGTPGRLVVLAPDLTALDALAPFATVAGTQDARTADPACEADAAVAAGDARAGGNLYRVTGSGGGTVLCYPSPDDSGRGSLVLGTDSGREVVVVGQPDVLRNAHLAATGDAALALRLLGAQPRLLWYLPDPAELAAGPDAPTLGELLPPWVPWVAVQLGIAALLAMFWRGRRLGRLVTEPLPVVVRAAETQEGRARLYRRARAHARAGATLRTAALRRLARRLDVPPDAAPDVVVTLAARAGGLPQAVVHATFLGPPPGDDRALVRLADEIAAVEHAVSTSSPDTSSLGGAR